MSCFIQCSPGLEEIILQEFTFYWNHLFLNQSMPEVTIEEGGISLDLKIEEASLLNYYLKTPNRILYQIETFKCRDFPKLFNKIKKINWSQFFAGQEIKLKISSQCSRIFDERKIERAIQDGISQFFVSQAPSKKAYEKVKQYKFWNLFVRLFEDTCTLSIDLSGERLGIRGYKKQVGIAPLRENLASSLIWAAKQHIDARTKCLIDPFAGSGTILLEANNLLNPNLKRNYASEYFPKIKCLRPQDISIETTTFDQYIAFEKDSKQIEFLRENLTALNDQVQIFNEDFNNNSHNFNNCCLITNPPYGERIKETMPTNLLINITRLFQPQYLGVLWPVENKDFKSPNDYERQGPIIFFHGGKKIRFLQYTKK